ncbi:MAG: hypothetical protein AB7N71_05985, partial [Phycisphaerae bacterium]
MYNIRSFRVPIVRLTLFSLGAWASGAAARPLDDARAIPETKLEATAATAGGPAIVIRECGRMQPGPQGCLQFITDDFSSAFFISNNGGVPFGTRVFVTGILNPQSQICPPLTGPGIENAIVGPCVSACGTIVPGILCNLFVTDDGQSYVLENEGTFNVGDRVWVRGRRVPQLPCGPAFSGPGIADNDIFECYEDCATLQMGPQGCPVLETSNGPGNLLFVENIEAFQIGDRVWVQGCLNPESTLCPPLVAPGVEDNAIGLCFEDCGTIEELPGFPCPVLRVDANNFAFLQNLGGFSVGDRVWVTGCLSFSSPLCPADAIPTIINNTIGECFQDCGTVDFLPGAPCAGI